MQILLRPAVLSFCLLAMLAPSAFAADNAELERIKRAIAEAIEPGSDPTAMKIVLAEPLSAAWRDDRAVVTLKGAKVVDSDGTLNVGDVEIAVLPHDDGLYDFDVTMPKSFDITGPDGAPEGKLTVAKYKLAGTWSREVASLVKLDATLQNLHVKGSKNGVEELDASLGAFDAHMIYTKNTSGLWDGTAKAHVSDLKILADKSEDIKIAAIDIESSTKGSDWAAWQRVMEKMEALSAPNAAPPDEGERMALKLALRNINWGANDGSLRIKGISAASGGKPIFVLGETVLRGTIDGSKESGTLSFGLGVDALSIEKNTLPSNLAPTKAKLDIALEKFPVQAFFGSMFEQVIDNMLSPPVAGGEEPDMAADNPSEPPPPEAQEPPMVGPFPADDLFLQQLFALGTVFALNEFSIDAPGTGMKASGRLNVDPESMTMGTGKIKATLRGIDALLAYANAEARTDDEMKDMAAFMIFLKGLGKPEGSGADMAYVYDIDIPKAGPPTVNGTPLDGMMGQ